MSDKELISIVVPAFNAERFLLETIESILAQTHRELDIIVVDDGSKDNTRQIGEEICRRDARVRLLGQQNLGVSKARNAGASVARGAFIGFLDADDTLAPDSLRLKLERLKSDNSLGLVHCDYQEMDVHSTRFGPTHVFPREGQILEDLLLLDEQTSFFNLGSCLLRMEVFKQSGGFDPELSNSADHEFLFRAAKVCRIGRAPHLGLYYRLHADSMHFNIKLLEKDLIASYRKADENALFVSPAFKRRCYGNMYFVLAGCWWNDGGEKWHSTRYLMRSLWTYPPVVLRLARRLRRRGFAPLTIRKPTAKGSC